MSHLTVNAALSQHLQGMGVPTSYENTDFTPPADQDYVAEFYLPAQTTGVGMEAGSTDDLRGVYQVSVFARRNSTSTKLAGMELARAVQARFARGTVLLKDGIRVLIENVSQASGRTSGDRWLIPVSAQFRCLSRAS